MELPKYVFNNPLYRFCNFGNKGNIKLIAVPNKGKFAIHNATDNQAIKSKLFDSIEKAEAYFF